MIKPGPKFGTDEYWQMRSYDRSRDPVCYIGSTDLAPILGLSPYKTALEWWLEKRNQTRKQVDTLQTRVGIALEPVVLSLYEDEKKVKVKANSTMFVSGDYPWLAATPDGLTDGKVINAKTSTYRRYSEFHADEHMFGADGTDALPQDYIIQAHGEMLVMEVEQADYPTLFDASNLRIYHVDRDEQVVTAILSATKEMLERLANNDPPEPNWTHPSTRSLLSDLHGYAVGESVALDAEQVEQWVEYQRLSDDIKSMEESKTAIANRILDAMGGCELGVFPSGEKALRRVVIKDSLYTEADVEKVRSKIGQVKRKGFEYLRQKKM